MSGVIVIGALLVLMLCAVGVVLALLGGGQRPESGLLAWLRESFTAWRSDELTAEKLRLRDLPEERRLTVEDLFDVGTPEDRPAYIRPEEITAPWDEVRQHRRDLTKH